MTTRNGLKGFILVETLVAIGVVAIAGVWLMGAYQSSLQLAQVSEQMSVAVNDLKDMMERIKTTSFANLQTDFPNGAVNGIVGGGADKYGAILGGYTLANEQVTVTHVPTTAADPRELIVQVSWTNGGRTYQQSVSTMRTSKAN